MSESSFIVPGVWRPIISTHLHDCSSIVRNGLSAIGIDKQEITTVRTESALDCCLHGDTSIDVGDDLALSLRGICAYMSKKHLAL
jgi:hypothetical protein